MPRSGSGELEIPSLPCRSANGVIQRANADVVFRSWRNEESTSGLTHMSFERRVGSRGLEPRETVAGGLLLEPEPIATWELFIRVRPRADVGEES